MNKWNSWQIAADVKEVLSKAPAVCFPANREEILKMATNDSNYFEVAYQVTETKTVVEATVSKCKNGIAINYPDPSMRRRDPDCMVIGDNFATDKPRFKELFNKDFSATRTETLDWLKKQKLAVIAISVGGNNTSYKGLLIAPANASFFVGAMADLQGLILPGDIPADFEPKTIVFVAPPFRHTHFEGKQIVVHNRTEKTHEIFAYNLYPGPSAKKGIYGVLLEIGEKENWLTLHGATVQVVTPYENVTCIIHEGASGSGKSEMLEYPHRERDGRLKYGTNSVTGESYYIPLHQSCVLKSVTDDMALSTPGMQKDNKKLVVADAEQAWFIRINHITQYGTDPILENICAKPPKPMIFINIDGVPTSTALIWEHIQDAPGKSCPNPRIVLPRDFIPDIVNEPVEVDYRSFGIRAPLCTSKDISYGIIGMLHVLPPALAWLWRLVSPRGDSNPSVTSGGNLSSEGVGSYWPFATGKLVNHANLLLQQILNTPQTRYVLLPNQHIGAWKVGFMPQWLSREYLARRGVAKFKPEQLEESRCSLLGYSPHRMMIEGALIPEYFLRVEKQPELGVEIYDKGADVLYGFFKKELEKYLSPELDKVGRDIINCFLAKGSISDYEKIIEMKY